MYIYVIVLFGAFAPLDVPVQNHHYGPKLLSFGHVNAFDYTAKSMADSWQFIQCCRWIPKRDILLSIYCKYSYIYFKLFLAYKGIIKKLS